MTTSDVITSEPLCELCVSTRGLVRERELGVILFHMMDDRMAKGSLVSIMKIEMEWKEADDSRKQLSGQYLIIAECLFPGLP